MTGKPFGGKQAPLFVKGGGKAGGTVAPKTAAEKRLEAKRGSGPKSAREQALERRRGINPKKGD